MTRTSITLQENTFTKFVSPNCLTASDLKNGLPFYRNMPDEIKNSKILKIRKMKNLNRKPTDGDCKGGYVIFVSEKNHNAALELLTKYDWPTIVNLESQLHTNFVWTSFIPKNQKDLVRISEALIKNCISYKRSNNFYISTRDDIFNKTILRDRVNKMNHVNFNFIGNTSVIVNNCSMTTDNNEFILYVPQPVRNSVPYYKSSKDFITKVIFTDGVTVGGKQCRDYKTLISHPENCYIDTDSFNNYLNELNLRINFKMLNMED
jgi:hypothetical protein